MDELIQRILNAIPNTSHTESSVRAVLNRLVSFGCTISEADTWEIAFVMADVENRIKKSCNTTSIPEGLFNTAVDMVCGQFLMTRKNLGRLEIADLNLNGAITSISEGDVSITFDNTTTDEQKFNQLVSYLMSKGEGDFVCFRKLSW